MVRRLNRKLSVAIGDVHIPFQDDHACKLALKFIRDQRPGYVHLLGDIGDFYAISRFDKDPLRRETLQEDIDAERSFLGEVRDAAGGGARIIYSEGNHETRLMKFLRSKAPELASLRCLSLPDLLGLDELEIEWQGHLEPYKLGSLMYTHGSLVRKWSAYSARAHWEKYGCCVMHGHTHRLGTFFHRAVSDTYGAWENGCLCRLDPEYTYTPDWQQGWSAIWTFKEYFHVEQIHLIKGRFNYHGKMYGRRKLLYNTHFPVKDVQK